MKLVCNVIGMGYYENMELRDNVIKKVRNYVKDNNIGGVSVDGWMGGYEVVVFFNRGDEFFCSPECAFVCWFETPIVNGEASHGVLG